MIALLLGIIAVILIPFLLIVAGDLVQVFTALLYECPALVIGLVVIIFAVISLQ